MKWSCVAATAILASGHETPPPDHTMMFDTFRMPYGKVYNGVDEVSVRFDNFKANVGVIRTTNAKHLSFWPRSTDTGRVCRNALVGKKQASMWGGLAQLGDTRVWRCSFGFIC